MSTLHVVRRVDGESKRRLTAEEILAEATGRYIDELGTGPEFRAAKCPPTNFKAAHANLRKHLWHAARMFVLVIPWLIALAAAIAHGGWIVHRLTHAAHLHWHHS